LAWKAILTIIVYLYRFIKVRKDPQHHQVPPSTHIECGSLQELVLDPLSRIWPQDPLLPRVPPETNTHMQMALFHTAAHIH